jgi:hypothetical protein
MATKILASPRVGTLQPGDPRGCVMLRHDPKRLGIGMTTRVATSTN